MTQEQLEQSILATLIYYDCFEWPLSTFELWSRLIPPLNDRPTTNDQRPTTKLSDIVFTLEHSEYLKQYIFHKNGFWFLRGKEHLYSRRIEATKESEEKLKRLFAYRFLFMATPFLLGAFVSGSVAGGWPDKKSDIDILIVAKKGRIWTARFFLTLFTTLFGIRRKGQRVAGQFCLNHYITDDALAIPFESLYNAHTYINLIPFMNRTRVFEKFFLRNPWLARYFFAPIEKVTSQDYIYQFPGHPVFEYIAKMKRNVLERLLGGSMGNICEHFAKRLQLYFINKNPLTGGRGGRVSAKDFALEFHPQSKEQEILLRYNKKLTSLGLTEFYPEQDSGLQ